MTTKKKKMNSYVKFAVIMLVCMIVGGIVGGSAYILNISDIGSMFSGAIDLVCRRQLPLLGVLAVTSFGILEYVLYKMKHLGQQMAEAEDEEYELLEYEMDKIGSTGTLANNISMVFGLLVISTGYNMEYIRGAENQTYLMVLILFMVVYFYVGVWQLRYVKLLQKIYPNKKGDPTSLKFQKQWIESCDEAEKEVIYQSSYKTYIIAMKLLPMLILVAMISHLMWNTGLMAVFLIGVIWITMSFTYCRSCIIKKGQKIVK